MTDTQPPPTAAGRWVVRTAPDWPDFAGPDWLDRILDADVPDREHRKQGRAIGRWTLTAADGKQLVVFLKRHFELPRRHGWLASVAPGRAWSPGLQEWQRLERANRAGVPVPRPLAAGEWRGPGGRLKGFLAVEELAGQLALHEAIPLAADRLHPAVFDQWKLGLVNELARLTHLMHGQRLVHRDLYLCHFFVPDELTRRPPTAWHGRVTVIDFHRFGGRGRLLMPWARAKDLGQLLYSTFGVPGVGRADRRRFWAAYQSFWGPTRLGAKLTQAVAELRAGRHWQRNSRRAAAAT